jgi:hypothetical protein
MVAEDTEDGEDGEDDYSLSFFQRTEGRLAI